MTDQKLQRHSIVSIQNEAATYFTDRANRPRNEADWFAERILELIVPRMNWKLSDDPSWTHRYATIRFAPELDSFEFLGTMIPRDELPSVISMMLHALDDADQARFECPECRQSRGYFVERGFHRCNACGYPGQ